MLNQIAPPGAKIKSENRICELKRFIENVLLDIIIR